MSGLVCAQLRKIAFNSFLGELVFGEQRFQFKKSPRLATDAVNDYIGDTASQYRMV
jgi:hypothetical protein